MSSCQHADRETPTPYEPERFVVSGRSGYNCAYRMFSDRLHRNIGTTVMSFKYDNSYSKHIDGGPKVRELWDRLITLRHRYELVSVYSSNGPDRELLNRVDETLERVKNWNSIFDSQVTS